MTIKVNPATGKEEAWCLCCGKHFNNHKGDLEKHGKTQGHLSKVEQLPSMLEQQRCLARFALPLNDRVTIIELRILASVCYYNQSISSAEQQLLNMKADTKDPVVKYATLGRTKAGSLLRQGCMYLFILYFYHKTFN